MSTTPLSQKSPGLRLFVLSFTSLFLELMVIRWVPSEVRLVAYYANLMLISSFLGLGIGAMLSSRNWRLFRFSGPLLLLSIVALLVFAHAVLPGSNGEWRFQATPSQKAYSYVVLVLIFITNAMAFMPLGEEIGRQFQLLPPLKAYSWDLGGSLCGTVFFGLFSLLHFSPILGMSLVIVLLIILSSKRQRIWMIPSGAIVLIAMMLTTNQLAYWSPYYFITISENVTVKPNTDPNVPRTTEMVAQPATTVPADLRTMRNPPLYTLHVNQDFYQMHATLDLTRYDSDNWRREEIFNSAGQYALPYMMISHRPERVLILGAGGGMDVEAALQQGASHVDAVEIDPLIPKLSNIYNAAAPYTRTDRVQLHIDDARSFLQNTPETYDLVAFGFLDSQALFSYGASLRLDGFTYTVESFRKAYEHVREGGAMSVAFFVGREWLCLKMIHMIQEATGVKPLLYDGGGKRIILIAPKATMPLQPPAIYHAWKRVELTDEPVAPATDDWPYLYLQAPSVPTDYAIVIGLLLVISLVTVTFLRGNNFGRSDAHFLFMGWGFLLLQTKSIGDCSLYFGTTWLVTTIVIAGVLIMVLLANLIAAKFLKSFSRWLFVPLFITLLLLLIVPRQVILGQSYGIRLAWSLIAVPLPIFFAGLIFSTTFRESANPAALFGSNLMGATIGGFCEYLGMWIGHAALGWIVIAAYLASLIVVRTQGPVSARGGGPS